MIDKIKLFTEYIKYILPYKNKWLALFILTGFGSCIGLINPYLAKLTIDQALGNKKFDLFLLLLIIGGVIFILEKFLEGAGHYLNSYIKLKAGFDLRKKTLKHMHHLPYGWFQDRAVGEHLYKLNYDIDVITEFITDAPVLLLSVFSKLLLTLAVLFHINWKMAVFSLFLVPFLYLPSYYLTKIIEKTWDKFIRSSEEIFKHLEEGFSNMLLIKVFGREIDILRSHTKGMVASLRIRINNIRIELFSGLGSEIISKSIAGLIILYGGYQITKGKFTLGELTAVMAYLYQLMGLQNQISLLFQDLAMGFVSCRRINEIFEDKTRIMEDKNANYAIFNRAEIIFQNVSFGHKPGRHVLKNLSFIIESGKHIALVGYSGCGKTTLLHLLVRLYDPWNGEISIDGNPIKKLKLNSLKEQIGFVLQQPFLWNDSIENNIKYGSKDINGQELITAAKTAGVDQFASALSQGYQTIIGEKACKISEGQKQKIAIARALIKKPKILVLDEAMSSMDSASEEKIISNIKQCQDGLTLITVSHRLSTVMAADLAYFFIGPDKIIIGDPSNLLKNNQDLFNLFAKQSNYLGVP